MLTEILYEDREVLVARKPAGLAVQTARVGQQDMVSELKNHLCRAVRISGTSSGQGQDYLGVIHRLDQPVEGLLVLAKSRRAAASLTEQLRREGEDGSFCKHYYAVLWGIPGEREGALEDYLYKESVRDRGRQEHRAVILDSTQGQGCPGARRAALKYTVLQTAGEHNLALADIRIETGRFHQIRAQMAHMGTPLLGDMKYGSEESGAAAQALGVRNVALCAYQLEFLHPVSKRRMEFRTRPENKAFSFFSQL